MARLSTVGQPATTGVAILAESPPFDTNATAIGRQSPLFYRFLVR